MISVIIATFNAAETLPNCIGSVAKQTYPHRELIIVDGGSTDGTVEILKDNSDEITYWESEPDRGIAHAWNKALGYAQGDWMIFLGADDYLSRSAVLAEMVPHLQYNSDKHLVFGQVLLRGGSWNGIIIGRAWNWKKFRRQMTIPHPAAFHSRRLFDEIGTYDESRRIALDYELLLRLKEKLSPVFVDKVVTVMFAGGLSMNYREESLAEGREVQLKYEVAPAYLINLWYVYFRVRLLKEGLEKALGRRRGK